MKRTRPQFLVNGKWISQKDYLAIPQSEYERIVARRKKLKVRGVDNS